MATASTFTPQELAELQQLDAATPRSPFLDLTAEELAELSIKDTTFDIPSEIHRNKELQKNPEVVKKAIDAFDIIHKRGFELSDVPGAVAHAPAAVRDFAVGAGKNAWNILTGVVGVPFGFAAEALTPMPSKEGQDFLAAMGEAPIENEAKKSRVAAEQKVIESGAASEASVRGLAQMVKHGATKVVETVDKSTQAFSDEDKAKQFWNRVAEIQKLEEATAGKGPVLQALGGNTIKTLEAEGKGVRPERVAELTPGDPFAFLAFSKVFKGLGRVVPAPVRKVGAAVSEKAGDLTAAAAGRTVQAAGALTELGARAVGGTAKAIAPAVGLVAGAVKGGPVGALAGLKGGEIAGRTIGKGAAVIERAGAGVESLGAQVAGVEPMVSPLAQVGRDVLQSTPGAIGEVGKGLGMDIGLAALTSETPLDTQGSVGIGAAFGAFGAAQRMAGRVVSGQIVGPRAWGSSQPVPSSGAFPSLDAAHSASITTAPPAVRERLNAVRQFAKGAAPGTDVFYAKDAATMEKALTDAGMSPADAKSFSEQLGFFTADLPGRDGTPRRVIGITDHADSNILGVDAAPHESFHAFQDVLGESANRALDTLIRQEYGDRWEHEAQRYAARLGNKNPAQWREFLLDQTGWGRVMALEKLSREAANQISAATGSFADPASVKDLVAGAWNEAMLATTAGPDVQKRAWRGIPGIEADAVEWSDRYIAREIAAENFDAVFKNLGASLAEQKGLIPKLARIVANTVSLLGGNPLAGRESQVGEIPLNAPVIEAIKGTVRGELPPVVDPKSSVTARPVITPSKGGIPSSPEDIAKAADDAREIAAAAPDVVPPGGLKSTRELLGAVAEAIAQRIGIKLNYLSAKDEPAASITSNRKARREMIEAFRSMPPEARALWEKNFFPERILRTSGGVLQVLGWAPEVFAANAHKLAAKLPQGLSPYPIDPATKTFTPEGWKKLYEDTQKFVQNQMGGRTGAGEPLVVPRSVEQAGFFKPPQTGAPEGIDQRTADFINLLFGVPLPKTPRITGGRLPLNIAGQDVSVATKPGRTSPATPARKPFSGDAAEQLGIAGREITEVNPLRAEIEAAGIKMPELIEAVQRLNAENIREVELAPEQPQFRSNTLMLSAGLQPRQFQPMPDNPRAVRLAAVKTKKGDIYTGIFHGYADEAARKAGNTSKLIEGYVTNEGEFLTRQEALERAVELQQIVDTDVIQDHQDYGLETNAFESARQFMPMPENPAAVRLPAVRDEKTGRIFEGSWHGDAMLKRMEAGLKSGRATHGFTTNRGEFLTREEAFQRAEEIKQITQEFADEVRHFAGKETLESQSFIGARKFQPREEKQLELKPGQRRVIITGPDGTEYPARFDGYQEAPWVPEGGIPQFTPEGRFPFQGDTKHSTTYGPAIEEAGLKLPADIPTFEQWESERSAEPAVAQFAPNADVQKVADEFAGRTLPHGVKPPMIDTAIARKLADYYESAESAPADEAVRASYDALRDETLQQLDAIEAAGYTIEPWTGKGEPYKNSAEMTADVQENKHLFYKPTADSFSGADENLMLRPVDIAGFDSLNDVFRAVHDFFGHAAEGYQFGPRGELAAWNAHSEMYSPEAQGALASETLAQNSWVNFGKHLEGKNIPQPERPFAEQKNLVVPDDLIAQAKAQFMPKKKLPNSAGDEEFQLTHFSSQSGLKKIDPKFFGKGKATPTDLRGAPKSYFFVKGSDFGQDANIFENAGLHAHEATVSGSKLYDLRKGKPDDLEWRKTINREEADNNVEDAGYDGIILDTADGRQVVAMFKPVKVGAQFQPSKEPDAIKSPAVKFEGKVFTGETHPQALLNAGADSRKLDSYYDDGKVVDGFVTNEGEFLTRRQAWKRAVKMGQIEPDMWTPRPGELESVTFESAQRRQFSPKSAREVPDDATVEAALSEDKKAFVGAHRDLDRGHPIGVRIDIPAFERTGDYVQTVHEMASGGKVGKRIGYDGIVTVDDPAFFSNETGAAKIKEGAAKFPVATVEGAWNPSRRLPRDLEDWTEVGYNPKRHSYFYEKSTEEPVISGSRAISVGNSVFVKDAVFGDRASFQFQPRGEQEQLFGGGDSEKRKLLTTTELSKMSRNDLLKHFPEAVVPRKISDPIPAEITRSPLFKKSKDPVAAFADKLVEFARSYEDDPMYQQGAKWYSDFTPALKKEFGEDAQLMAELLAATSPRVNPQVNFSFALEALEGFRSGKFKRIIDKFNEGMEIIASGKWKETAPTEASFLAKWVDEHDLKPRQSNSKLYGMHSMPVLQVLARRWLNDNRGLKTINFVKNLVGLSDEATIDVWADRTMRRIGYAGKERWRILPGNTTGVSDVDFKFSQKAFRAAAEKLDMKPSALQGALWFAEKSLWGKNGWARLDFGDFSKELVKTGRLREEIRARETGQTAELELPLVEPRNIK